MKKNLILCLAFVLLGSAQVSLGQDFDKGLEAYNRGDYATASQEWKPFIEEEAEYGNAPFQMLLGLMYREGKGVPQDYKEALKWFLLAAEQGLASAQNSIGGMYANGEGVIQDDIYAHMWLNIAAAAGDEKAIDNRDVIKERMTPSQIAEAQRLARECVAKDYKGC